MSAQSRIELRLERAHQFVRVAHHHALLEILADLAEALLTNLELARDLRRLQIIVDQAAGLVLDLVRRNAVLAPVGASTRSRSLATSAESNSAKSTFSA